MTLEQIEQEIYEHYHARTDEVIRVLGRENYLRNPVRIQEVGYLANLWALFDLEIEEREAENG